MLSKQGCVRGQHGRGQGQGQGSSSPRPRPQNFVLKVSLRSWSWSVREDPHPWAFYRTMLRRERLCHVVCLSITLKFSALLPPLVLVDEVLYLWYWLFSPLIINHTQKFNVLRPDLEAKVKAVHRRGQGRRSSRPRPRPQNFVLELSSRSRPVLEDPIPVNFFFMPHCLHFWFGATLVHN